MRLWLLERAAQGFEGENLKYRDSTPIGEIVENLYKFSRVGSASDGLDGIERRYVEQFSGVLMKAYYLKPENANQLGEHLILKDGDDHVGKEFLRMLARCQVKA